MKSSVNGKQIELDSPKAECCFVCYALVTFYDFMSPHDGAETKKYVDSGQSDSGVNNIF